MDIDKIPIDKHILCMLAAGWGFVQVTILHAGTFKSLIQSFKFRLYLPPVVLWIAVGTMRSISPDDLRFPDRLGDIRNDSDWDIAGIFDEFPNTSNISEIKNCRFGNW